jgi:CRISPR-associated protein Cmr2
MSEVYWQAKIWGLLHDPILKALHDNTGRGGNSFWKDLPAMKSWVEQNLNPEDSNKKILKHIKLADYITSASDRSAIGSLSTSLNYNDKGLQISHLLSGKKLTLKLQQHQQLISNRRSYLENKEQEIFNTIPEIARNDIKCLFWWLWRCLPEAVFQLFDDTTLMLMPAETRIPDSSLWSHGSLTAAIAGALAGYDLTIEEITERWEANKPLSHAYLASFSFSPIQELIKASRKMRDFWAGSWILHYLAAKVSWKLALQYGPDCLLYPSLYQQPLIDLWLLEKYPGFKPWIKSPTDRTLLTAGFPNVIVLVLPRDKVAAAMQTAKSELLNTWKNLSDRVFDELQERHWKRALNSESNSWKGWLDSQWQTYWTAVPLGKEGEPLKSGEIYEDKSVDQKWIKLQNETYGLTGEKSLFLEQELAFLRKAADLRRQKQGKNPFSANVGSWWNHAFDQTRLALAAVKNARDWEIPTAFGPRSTVSGLGPVVHPGADWVTEAETKKYWQRNAGLFDGREQLNATETVKRGLQQILPKLLKLDKNKIDASYPDLTAGVAGYLKNSTEQEIEYFKQTCQAINKKLLEDHRVIPDVMIQSWGIPWIDNNKSGPYHPRLLNAGWLMEDLDIPEEEIPNYRNQLQQVIDRYYPNNNPADWYVIAAGDGDSMSEWLKGNKLASYRKYIPDGLQVDGEIRDSFEEFVDLTKRMGPSTHNALSRALLDFSNQLVPYLTEQRYAGRLIYGGGDDVLAYTNLWEWDNWLWDIQECFRGQKDPHSEFNNSGNYWQWNTGQPPKNLASRPLFTMGSGATISFGIVIAHHSVPLAIALENLWEAEEAAKEHIYEANGQSWAKDALQVRVIYGNGNTLESTAKFDSFHKWQALINQNVESSIFEQAANLWQQHPIPYKEAIHPWTNAFCGRREQLGEDKADKFEEVLTKFLESIWETTLEKNRDIAAQNWLKLAAFTKRNRQIKIT